jgi:hypothetical protein
VVAAAAAVQWVGVEVDSQMTAKTTTFDYLDYESIKIECSAKRTPNEAVLVVFRPRAKQTLGLDSTAEAV